LDKIPDNTKSETWWVFLRHLEVYQRKFHFKSSKFLKSRFQKYNRGKIVANFKNYVTASENLNIRRAASQLAAWSRQNPTHRRRFSSEFSLALGFSRGRVLWLSDY
jgi:hypothetical protein